MLTLPKDLKKVGQELHAEATRLQARLGTVWISRNQNNYECFKLAIT
jgi:hypothetical protein